MGDIDAVFTGGFHHRRSRSYLDCLTVNFQINHVMSPGDSSEGMSLLYLAGTCLQHHGITLFRRQ
jgi:hypothetical protein